MRKFTNTQPTKIMFRILPKNVAIRRSRVLLAGLALLLFSGAGVKAQSIQEGQALFGTKCYSCHNIGSGDKTGPDLKGVTTRRTKPWLQEFVNTPAAMNAKAILLPGSSSPSSARRLCRTRALRPSRSIQS
jgi:hypothetical protein